MRKQLEDPSFTIKMFDDALASKDWPSEPDRVADQYPRTSATQAKNAFDRNNVDSYGTHTVDASGQVSFHPSRAQTTSAASEPRSAVHSTAPAKALRALLTASVSQTSAEPALGTPTSTTSDMLISAANHPPETPPRPQRRDQHYIAAAAAQAASLVNTSMSPASSLRRRRREDEDPDDVFSPRTSPKRIKSGSN